MHFSAGKIKDLLGVSNGIRLLAVHSPRELSGALQLGPDKQNLPCFELLGNVYLQSTDKGMLRPRGTTIWPQVQKLKPKAELHLARLKYGGAYDPEPLAWSRLGILLANRHRVRLTVSEPMAIAKLNAVDWPLAAMTGTRAFELSDDERESLRKYLTAGGTLIVDAAGGSREFPGSAESQILTLLPDGVRGALAASVVMEGPEPIERIRYRRDYSLALGPAAGGGSLRRGPSHDRRS